MNVTIRSGHSLMLIIDDKAGSLKNLDKSMQIHGFNTVYEQNTQNAMKVINNYLPNIILISEKITDVSAMEICYYTRNIDPSKNCLVFIVKFSGSIEKEISFEQNGPNSYLMFDKDENDLITKIKYSVMANRQTEKEKCLKYLDIEMYLNSYTVSRKGYKIKLGPTEFKLLQCFLEYQENTLSREFLMSYVWGKSDSIEPRTIDVHINRLRNALKLSPDELPLIETIRSLGYRLRELVPVTAK